MSQKVVAITGASRGIGKAIALKYAREGYHVAICCHTQADKLMAVQQEILALSVDCITFIGDMGNYEAGISHIGLIQDMSPAEWEHILSSNLSSVFYCSQLATKMMLPAKSGKILSISSVWGCAGASAEVAYSTTKGGINAFTKALAKELAPSNIQVNAIACGIINTEMNAFLSKEELNNIIEEIPSGRMGTAEEAAELAFAINKKNDYLTGQVIILDGGWL